MAPHRPQKSSNVEYTTDEEDMIVYDMGEEIESPKNGSTLGGSKKDIGKYTLFPNLLESALVLKLNQTVLPLYLLRSDLLRLRGHSSGLEPTYKSTRLALLDRLIELHLALYLSSPSLISRITSLHLALLSASTRILTFEYLHFLICITALSSWVGWKELPF
ncbi:hypothetical protein TNCV_3233831 [Trichonephila clavipes]|nr:hypothetical protein TNCV_3233831 [Trichonephila clavipes]